MLNNKTTSAFFLVTLPPYLLLSLQTARLVPRLPGMKVPNELIFSWLSWLAVLLVGATYDDDDEEVAPDGGHTPAKRLTETYSLDL